MRGQLGSVTGDGCPGRRQSQRAVSAPASASSPITYPGQGRTGRRATSQMNAVADVTAQTDRGGQRPGEQPAVGSGPARQPAEGSDQRQAHPGRGQYHRPATIALTALSGVRTTGRTGRPPVGGAALRGASALGSAREPEEPPRLVEGPVAGRPGDQEARGKLRLDKVVERRVELHAAVRAREQEDHGVGRQQLLDAGNLRLGHGEGPGRDGTLRPGPSQRAGCKAEQEHQHGAGRTPATKPTVGFRARPCRVVLAGRGAMGSSVRIGSVAAERHDRRC